MKQQIIQFINWKPGRIIGAALVVLFAAAFIAGPAAGQGLSIASSVQAGEVVDNDLLLTGLEGVIDGTVIGNVFATGKEVTVNGDIEGSLFVVGDKLTVNGQRGRWHLCQSVYLWSRDHHPLLTSTSTSLELVSELRVEQKSAAT